MSRLCLICREEPEWCRCQAPDEVDRSGGWASEAQRNRVLARDRWLCQVCDRYINPRIRPPEPGSAHLDRLRPLEAGGQDAEWNLRAIHLECVGADLHQVVPSACGPPNRERPGGAVRRPHGSRGRG